MSLLVSHLSYQANPYPLYASYRSQETMFWDHTVSAWIVSRADHVRAILLSEDCLVRPRHEKVPQAIQNGAAGKLFGELLRMNEGEYQSRGKAALLEAMQSLHSEQLSQTMTEILHEEALSSLCKPKNGSHLTQWMMQIPVRCMAIQLGFDRASSALIARDIADFVNCLSVLSSEQQLQAASLAAERLLAQVKNLERSFELSLTGSVQPNASQVDAFPTAFKRAADQHGWHSSESRWANLVGLLSQTYEATAGLLGNCLVQLAERPQWRQRLHTNQAEYGQWRRAFVSEVARFDPAIHSTRRFVRRDCRLLDQQLRADDVIIVLLAAANRDTRVVPGAEEFEPQRYVDKQQWGFSAGRHQCPGQALAIAIVTDAISYVIDHWQDVDWQALQYHYQTSLNARIPVFTQQNEALTKRGKK